MAGGRGHDPSFADDSLPTNSTTSTGTDAQGCLICTGRALCDEPCPLGSACVQVAQTCHACAIVQCLGLQSGQGAGSAGNGGSGNGNGNTSPSDPAGVSPGTKAGAAVGSIFALVGVLILGYAWLRFRRCRERNVSFWSRHTRIALLDGVSGDDADADADDAFSTEMTKRGPRETEPARAMPPRFRGRWDIASLRSIASAKSTATINSQGSNVIKIAYEPPRQPKAAVETSSRPLFAMRHSTPSIIVHGAEGEAVRPANDSSSLRPPSASGFSAISAIMRPTEIARAPTLAKRAQPAILRMPAEAGGGGGGGLSDKVSRDRTDPLSPLTSVAATAPVVPSTSAPHLSFGDLTFELEELMDLDSVSSLPPPEASSVVPSIEAHRQEAVMALSRPSRRQESHFSTSTSGSGRGLGSGSGLGGGSVGGDRSPRLMSMPR